MRKYVLSTLLFLSFLTLRSQSWVYHPFPTDSAVWTTTRGTYNVLSCCPAIVEYYPEPPDRYCLPGTDTIIGSVSYSKVYRCGGAYKGGLRDDSIARKVFFIPADSTSELLIYDFSVSAGDTAFVYEQHPFGNDFYPVQYGYISTDSVMVNGSYRKRINLNGNPGTWVEGIGCTKGLFRESWPNVSNWYNDLECMSDGYLTLYPSPSMGPCSLVSGVNEASEQIQALEIYPNPTNGKLNIHSEAEMNKIEVVDLLGRVISFMELKGMNAEIDLSDTPSGVYFIRISHQKENSVTKKIVKQ